MKNKVKIPVLVLMGPPPLTNISVVLEASKTKDINTLNYAIHSGSEVFVTSVIDFTKPITYDNIHNVGLVCVPEPSKATAKNIAFPLMAKGRGLLNSAEEGFVSKDSGNDATILFGDVAQMEYFHTDTTKTRVLLGKLKESALQYFAKAKETDLTLRKAIEVISDPNLVVNLIATNLSNIDRMKILRESDTEVRIEETLFFLAGATEIVATEEKIRKEFEEKMRAFEKDSILRSHIKALQGQLNDGATDEDILEEKIKALEAGEEVKAKLIKECGKLRTMGQASQESNIIRSYLEFAVSLPWKKVNEDKILLSAAREILDADHYGIEKVKERILEYLAVKILKNDGNHGSILCLVGPPGVGKTSVAKSIAKATGKKYIQMSLGGVRDEAEIRGHRKTYLGAMPGRILTHIAQVGISNPLMLLDEVDKLTNDSLRGDPSSALLEVLDQNQNANFRDNYLEMPYDLSGVMFIATANSTENIQAPLLDRMEIINMEGYTADEKLEIAKRYLIPKRIEENGLLECEITLSDEVITTIIESYTREAGVRGLERKIDAIFRKLAVKHLEGAEKKFVLSKEDLVEYLGTAVKRELASEYITSEGIATGLAWTSTGGETLYIEVSTTDGKGNLTLTGKLGDVMQESAKTAVSFIKANTEKFGIQRGIFEKTDLHIHVPEGATPKDGPSAGITIATAVVSALTKKRVRNDLAMTGEITLRGKVLPIGGLKEKALAGVRSGVSTIVIPQGNEKDILELPQALRDKVRFIAVENACQAIENAINFL